MATNKPNSGVAFFNLEKSKETHPDFRGNATIDGKDYSVGVWLSKAKSDGKMYYYFSFTEKEELGAEKND